MKTTYGIHGGRFTQFDDGTVQYSPSPRVMKDLSCFWRFWRPGEANRKLGEEVTEYWSHAWDHKEKDDA